MKKILKFIFIFLCIFLISSCTHEETENTLDTPILTVKEGVLRWNKIDNATSYILLLNDEEITLNQVFYDLNQKDELAFKAKVKAISDTLESEYSNEVTYEKQNNDKIKLEAPIINMNGRTLSWEKIENATHYEIYINNSILTSIQDTSYTFAKNISGNYQIYVIAKSSDENYENSSPSNVLVHTFIEEILTIKEVKDLIDENQNRDVFVRFKGRVIGSDSNGYVHVQDSTGTIYVRAYDDSLKVGNNVLISGYGFVYKGSYNYPEYTRQIKSDNLLVEKISEEINYEYDIITLTNNELSKYNKNNSYQASFSGNIVKITGIVKVGLDRYSFYLLDNDGNKLVQIHHYSSNFNNNTTDSTKNVFLNLDGKEVTITGIIYRYYSPDEIFTIQCIGLSDELVVNENKLRTPKLTVTNTVVSWSEVENASLYQIYVDGLLVDEISGLSYDLASSFDNGTYFVKVKAKNDTQESNFSEEACVMIGQRESVVNLFMINDTHGSFVSDQYPGVEKLSSVIKSLEKQNGDYIKIANGDIFQGTYASSILYGRPMVDALNEMKFDCFVLGNHEFDWGLDEIKKYKDGDLSNGEANFPILGANVYDKTTNQRVSWLDPYTIVEKNGLRVGIIGLIGYELESSILYDNVKDYDFIYPLELVKNYASELRTKKECDSVIISIHDYDEALNNEFAKLKGDERIDAILCGHTHQNIYDRLTRSDNSTIVAVENKDKNQSALSVSITLQNERIKETQVDRLLPNAYLNDPDLEKIIDKYKSTIDEGNRVLGYNYYTMSRSALGFYATSAMKDEFNVDISIMNTGGVRNTISAGNFTVANVFEVFPFNNHVILVDMSGKNIKSLYYNNESYLYFNEEFDASSLVNDKTYKVAVIDYVYTSTRYEEFKNTTGQDSMILLRDLVIDYLDNIF